MYFCVRPILIRYQCSEKYGSLKNSALHVIIVTGEENSLHAHWPDFIGCDINGTLHVENKGLMLIG